MAKYLRDVSIYPYYTEEAKEWSYSTNFLEYLYLNCLPKVETRGVAKIVILPCRALPDQPFKLSSRKPDIYHLSKLFDFDLYFKSDKEARKCMALELLQGGLIDAAKALGWNTKPFLEAYKAVLAKNFVYYHPWSKTISSPNRKYKAQAWCNFDSDKAEIFIVFSHRKEIVGKTLVTSVKPGGVWIREAVGKLEWVSPEKVKLTSKDGKQSWEATLGDQVNEPTSQP